MVVPFTIKIHSTGEVMTYIKSHKGIHTYHIKGIEKDMDMTINDENLSRLLLNNHSKIILYNTSNFEL